ncbi:MAG: o-succinylbenzoate synthase, partial [Acidobacteria bacterium ACB2]|nr:o-succinylbenzoate synthase [Acidobacteria bacterium ACB2]
MSGPAGGTEPVRLEAEKVPAVERIDLVRVRLPFVRPFSISTATWTCKETVLLRVEGGGVTGWGECVADPDPFYAPETTTTAGHVVTEFLLPLVEPGITFGDLDRLFARIRGNRMAKATVENALVDL